jgi:3-hydroxyisobutyrate dehydrogenase-like beta-hydroxyacid dehydrogenase
MAACAFRRDARIDLIRRNDMTQRIGFIGIGMMGHGMAKNLVAKGFPLVFRVNRNRANIGDLVAAGAREVRTSAEVAQNADIVFLCVTGTPQVEEVIFGQNGLCEGAREGLVVVDTSTSEPASTNRIREDLKRAGVTYVDAPLARTPKEAEEGRLNIMVGADPAVFERLQPVLAAFCENVFHVGPPGAGHVVKLLNNFLAMTIATSTAEAFAACSKAGVPAEKLHMVISAGAVNSGIFQAMFKAFSGDFTGLKFAIDNARKDLRYYTHLAEGLPTASLIGEAVHQTFVLACNQGYGEKFIASLLEVQEKLNDVKILKT